jgi:hypothetical protein
MNWSIFYQLNEALVDTFMLGLTYFIMYVIFTLTLKNLVKNIKEDDYKRWVIEIIGDEFTET